MSKIDLEQLRSRKPAKRMSEVPRDVLDALMGGQLESKNLVEWLSVDRLRLLNTIRKELGLDIPASALKAMKADMEGAKALKASMAIGKHLSAYVQVPDPIWRSMTVHCSDIVREWSAILIGHSSLTFAKKLAWVKSLADDSNAGVREIAWLGLRADVLRDPLAAIRSLTPWTGSRQERLRRFASEITRPCGVWTSHCPLLKREPHLGLPILEPLRADESKYVRDSVSNWLNDASKSDPDWVIAVTDRWLQESASEHTQYIVRRALRTLRKKS